MCAAEQEKPKEEEQHCANFETAIDAAGYGRFHVLVQLMTLLALCATVFESSTMSYILPIAECDLNLTLYDKGILNGTGYAGMIVSAIIWGYLADTKGRRIVLLVGFLLDAVCIILSGFSQNFAFLVTFKFLGGVFINGPTATIFTYVSEVHGSEHRSRAIMFTGVWATAANLALPLLSWAIFPTNWAFTIFSTLKINEWQIFLLVSALPSLICGLFMIFLPESPKFLMSQGRNSEALNVFQHMYVINTRQTVDSFPIKKLIQEVPNRESNNKESIYTIEEPSKIPMQEATKSVGFLAALHSGMEQVKPLLRKPLLGYAFHALLMQFCIAIGHSTIRLWLPQLFASTAEYEALQSDKGAINICAVLEYSVNKSTLQAAPDAIDHCLLPTENNSSLDMYLSNIIVAASGIVGYFFAGMVVKFLGNKGMCTYGLLISGGLCIGLYWSSSSLSTLIISCFFITISMISSSSLLGVVMALFPTSLRTLVVALALMFARIGGLSGNVLFPYLMELGCLPPFLLCGSMLLCAGLLAIILPKTQKDMI